MMPLFTKFRVFGLLLLVVIGITAVSFWLRGSVEGKKIKRIVLISMDTTRADYLSCYGYRQYTTPNIDELAKEGILFENVISPIPQTLPAHSSMFTGTIPPYHRVHYNIDYKLSPSNVTLAEILKEAGFTTSAFISSFMMDSQLGIDQGFDTYSDSFEKAYSSVGINERKGGETSRLAAQWLDKHKDESFFLFLHYFDPHKNYEPPEPFASKFPQNPYAGEIAYTDYCIGQVITRLKELGLYDSTLIIITSDHGEMLGEHGEDVHAYFIYQSAIKVPLVFKVPGRNKTVRIKQLAGLIDIVPTVCSLLDIEPPAVVQGVDLSGCFGGRELFADRGLYCESLLATAYGANSLLGIVTDSFKYIQTTRPELYNLVNDPAESNNLIDQQLNLARILKDRLAQIIKQSAAGDSDDSKVELDDETRRRLESLGYVGGDVVEGFDFDKTKDDPKDVLNFHLLSGKIAAALVSKQYDLAMQMAEEMIRIRPDSASSYEYAGQTAHRQGDPSSAATYFQKALKLKPDSARTHNDLGLALESLGKTAQAIEYFQQALALKPDFANAHNNLGTVLEKIGKPSEAVEHYQQAVKLRPDIARYQYSLGIVLEKIGKPSEAVEHYQQAVKLEPDKAGIHYSLGNTLMSLGKFAESVEHYQQALKLKPGYADAHNNLARLYHLQGKTDLSVKHAHEVLREKPDSGDVLNFLAWIKATHEDVRFRNAEEAVQLAQRACEITNYRNPELLDTLAAAYAAAGNFPKAIETSEKALEFTQEANQEKLAEEIGKHLEFYKAGKAYRER